ncbi:hypothetical protein [Chimaeribacter arupi]|jgi:hypothetical protein|uniref:hypothetical protein n=1 Tax=Chimaeribacter arupi TaxID=2060066 RepID=UPI0011AF3F28|nr:hypothetical protein [Chimaeribacter arupi]
MVNDLPFRVLIWINKKPRRTALFARLFCFLFIPAGTRPAKKGGVARVNFVALPGATFNFSGE